MNIRVPHRQLTRFSLADLESGPSKGISDSSHGLICVNPMHGPDYAVQLRREIRRRIESTTRFFQSCNKSRMRRRTKPGRGSLAEFKDRFSRGYFVIRYLRRGAKLNENKFRPMGSSSFIEFGTCYVTGRFEPVHSTKYCKRQKSDYGDPITVFVHNAAHR